MDLEDRLHNGEDPTGKNHYEKKKQEKIFIHFSRNSQQNDIFRSWEGNIVKP